MSTLDQTTELTVSLPRPTWWQRITRQRRRRRVTIDLIHSSPHLLADIGVVTHRVTVRRP